MRCLESFRTFIFDLFIYFIYSVISFSYIYFFMFALLVSCGNFRKNRGSNLV